MNEIITSFLWMNFQYLSSETLFRIKFWIIWVRMPLKNESMYIYVCAHVYNIHTYRCHVTGNPDVACCFLLNSVYVCVAHKKLLGTYDRL